MLCLVEYFRHMCYIIRIYFMVFFPRSHLWSSNWHRSAFLYLLMIQILCSADRVVFMTDHICFHSSHSHPVVTPSRSKFCAIMSWSSIQLIYYVFTYDLKWFPPDPTSQNEIKKTKNSMIPPYFLNFWFYNVITIACHTTTKKFFTERSLGRIFLHLIPLLVLLSGILHPSNPTGWAVQGLRVRSRHRRLGHPPDSRSKNNQFIFIFIFYYLIYFFIIF